MIISCKLDKLTLANVLKKLIVKLATNIKFFTNFTSANNWLCLKLMHKTQYFNEWL